MDDMDDMNEETLYRLEREAEHHAPFNVKDFLEPLEVLKEKIINYISSLYRDEIYTFYEGTREEPAAIESTPKVVNEHVKECTNIYLANFEEAVDKLHEKICEIMFIPNHINLHAAGDGKSDINSLETEVKQLRQEVLEQMVFFKYLKQELIGHHDFSDLLKQTEKFIKVAKQLPGLNVPKEIINELFDNTSDNNTFINQVYKLP